MRKNQMRPVRDVEPAFGFDPELSQFFDLGVEGLRLDHHAVSDDAQTGFVKYSRRDQVKHKLALTDSDRMACVVAALVSGHDFEVGRQYVDDFAFAFVAPLTPDANDVLHDCRNRFTGADEMSCAPAVF